MLNLVQTTRDSCLTVAMVSSLLSLGPFPCRTTVNTAAKNILLKPGVRSPPLSAQPPVVRKKKKLKSLMLPFKALLDPTTDPACLPLLLSLSLRFPQPPHLRAFAHATF